MSPRAKSPKKEKTAADPFYASFLESRSAEQWRKLGVKKRAGAAAPLFSIYSKNSIGIGELPDLKLLVDWSASTSLSIIQLLPMNDVGFDFRPYDAQSSFALEPVYLSLTELEGGSSEGFKADLEKLRKRFPAGKKGGHVDYGVKAAKLEFLWRVFTKSDPGKSKAFAGYCKKNDYWLEDYAAFKVLKEQNGNKSWEDWPTEFKNRDAAALKRFAEGNKSAFQFQKWIQWQLFEQFCKVKAYGLKAGVFLMGDLPFLVSRDSADVWAHQDYFKLDRVSGAPPDMYIAKGQRWGMPAYCWEKIASSGYDYVIQKLKYAENFYDLYRIDHVVGMFRLWTIDSHEPFENCGLNGKFDPSEEYLWEEHGRRIICVMAENSGMLACAEDLGVIPDCSFKVLHEFGIPGIDVQRWNKNWNTDKSFKRPEEYRKNSIANITSHDMSTLRGWWQFEAGAVDGELFERKCQEKGISFREVRERLFDLKTSRHGKLRWKKEVWDVDALLGLLGRSRDDAWEFVEMYLGSYGEKIKFLNFLGLDPSKHEKNPGDAAFVRKALEKVNESSSVFSIQLLQDWLSLDPSFEYDPWNFRINFPGTMNDKNWSLVMPLSLEEIKKLPMNKEIDEINRKTGRVNKVKESS